MIENLESRQFMSVTLPTTDMTTTTTDAQPPTEVVVEASAKQRRSPLTFMHLVDKASPG